MRILTEQRNSERAAEVTPDVRADQALSDSCSNLAAETAVKACAISCTATAEQCTTSGDVSSADADNEAN